MDEPTVYDTLDSVQNNPGMMLGGLDANAINGTKMMRLQAFLSGLTFAQLDHGEPPFSSFSWWLSASVDWINNTHNAPFHELEQHFPQDEAFDFFFERLDEYRSCKVVEVCRSTGPFTPKTNRLNSGELLPPTAVIVGQFKPSLVFFWGIEGSSGIEPLGPFYATLESAKSAAEEAWGIGFGRSENP